MCPWSTDLYGQIVCASWPLLSLWIANLRALSRRHLELILFSWKKIHSDTMKICSIIPIYFCRFLFSNMSFKVSTFMHFITPDDVMPHHARGLLGDHKSLDHECTDAGVLQGKKVIKRKRPRLLLAQTNFDRRCNSLCLHYGSRFRV